MTDKGIDALRNWRPPPEPDAAQGYAIFKQIERWIRRFDAALDAGHETGFRLASFGAEQFHLTGMSYLEPAIILLFGETEAGEPVELVQHVTQTSILLMRVKRTDPSKPKTPIGFTP